MFYNWKIAFLNPRFKSKLCWSLVIFISVLFSFAFFLAHIEIKQGHMFYDPILNFIKPRDVSNLIFFISYSAAISGFIYAVCSPYRFLHLLQMFSFLTILRVVSLFFIPINPPLSIINSTNAIFAEHTLYAGSEFFKNFFFSGHSASLFLFYFFTTNKVLKYSFLIAAILVSIGLMIQHANYSVDLLSAPVSAYLAYRLIIKFSKHYNRESISVN